MGGWKTVFDGRVEERPVIVKVYERDDAEDQARVVVRALTTSIDNDEDLVEQRENGPALIASSEEAGAPMILDDSVLDNLKEGMLEAGFSHEATTQIVCEVLIAEHGRTPTFEELQKSDGMPFEPQELAAFERFVESFDRPPTFEELAQLLEPRERQNLLRRLDAYCRPIA